MLEFFNGGGSGNFAECCEDDSISEITAGSGCLQSSLFDYYVSNKNKCAMVFGLQITRKFARDVYVCQSGGFIASGQISEDKQPVPYLPSCTVFNSEGFGGNYN